MEIDDSSLKCFHCKQAYDVYEAAHIVPCCGQSLCHRCVKKIKTEMSHTKYKCVSCEQQFLIPKEGFQLNSQIAEQLLEQSDLKTKQEQNNNLNKLDQSVKELLFEMNNGQTSIIEHFRDQKRLVQLATEERIEQLNQCNELLINQLKDYEQTLL